jgi:hypothetical protein
VASSKPARVEAPQESPAPVDDAVAEAQALADSLSGVSAKRGAERLETVRSRLGAARGSRLGARVNRASSGSLSIASANARAVGRTVRFSASVPGGENAQVYVHVKQGGGWSKEALRSHGGDTFTGSVTLAAGPAQWYVSATSADGGQQASHGSSSRPYQLDIR